MSAIAAGLGLPAGGGDPWARNIEPGIDGVDLIIPDAHCAGCIARIERGLAKDERIEVARLNLSTKRLSITWQRGALDTARAIRAVRALGFDAKPLDPATLDGSAQESPQARSERELLRALAIAGFAAGNVMLLSVSVWSGAADSTRELFHWLSALIALPAVIIAGRPFYRSAWRALRARSLNMDVPISLAVILAAGMSLFETIEGGHTTYFDASVMLLFFLLIGRYLDRRMRGLAHRGATQLMALSGTAATVLGEDGSERAMAVREVEAGMKVIVRPGERVPVDGVVIKGRSEIDRSLVTGESVPEVVAEGATVHAGCDNLTGPLHVKVRAVGEGTLLAEIVRLVEAAEKGRGAYVRLADRAARIYAPAVHLLALIAFIFWFWVSGDWRTSLITAIAVLIITCPCALGLAVPVVQVVAAQRLMRRGIMMKQGEALEKLAEVDRVALDKTGTLTSGQPVLRNAEEIEPDIFAIAAGLGQGSRHPLARAIHHAAVERGVTPADVEAIEEVPGSGLRGFWHGNSVALGRADFAHIETNSINPAKTGYRDGPVSYLFVEGREPAIFTFADALRQDSAEVVGKLAGMGLRPKILSGDRPEAAGALAANLGLDGPAGGLAPGDKLAWLQDAARNGEHVLMVGDGINDMPALAAAHVSMSPASAADISRNAADFIYMGEGLTPVLEAQQTARRARRLILQNFGLAALYNAIAIPIAFLGYASPLVAAIAMSTSSILVTANALRLN